MATKLWKTFEDHLEDPNHPCTVLTHYAKLFVPDTAGEFNARMEEDMDYRGLVSHYLFAKETDHPTFHQPLFEVKQQRIGSLYPVSVTYTPQGEPSQYAQCANVTELRRELEKYVAHKGIPMYQSHHRELVKGYRRTYQKVA